MKTLKIYIIGALTLFSITVAFAQTEIHDAKITGNIPLGNLEITAIQDLETECIYKSEPHEKGLFARDEHVKIIFENDRETGEIIKPNLPEVVYAHRNGCGQNKDKTNPYKIIGDIKISVYDAVKNAEGFPDLTEDEIVEIINNEFSKLSNNQAVTETRAKLLQNIPATPAFGSLSEMSDYLYQNKVILKKEAVLIKRFENMMSENDGNLKVMEQKFDDFEKMTLESELSDKGRVILLSLVADAKSDLTYWNEGDNSQNFTIPLCLTAKCLCKQLCYEVHDYFGLHMFDPICCFYMSE